MYLSLTVPDVYSLSNLRLKLAFTCPVYERRSTVQKSPLLDYFCTQSSHLHCHLHIFQHSLCTREGQGARRRF